MSGQLWRALILLNSLSEKDSNALLFTNTHLEKFSLQLINKSLSSSIIALTLLELISYNQIFSITFWYSILKQEFQSEFYLFCIRISFLINNPQEDYFDKFI
ncbi:unnamed protein product, partial [Rotaria sp. Silwood1]